jgi:hypothetical protein
MNNLLGILISSLLLAHNASAVEQSCVLPGEEAIAENCVLKKDNINRSRPYVAGEGCIVKIQNDTVFRAKVNVQGGWPTSYIIGKKASDTKVFVTESDDFLTILQTSGNLFLKETNTIKLDQKTGELSFISSSRSFGSIKKLEDMTFFCSVK